MNLIFYGRKNMNELHRSATNDKEVKKSEKMMTVDEARMSRERYETLQAGRDKQSEKTEDELVAQAKELFERLKATRGTHDYTSAETDIMCFFQVECEKVPSINLEEADDYTDVLKKLSNDMYLSGRIYGQHVSDGIPEYSKLNKKEAMEAIQRGINKRAEKIKMLEQKNQATLEALNALK
ncbi:MAG: hypothetical protein CO141_00250 [Candidatus Moranbacteria bacterium CG_4_9_14_3_um_filter_42_9]|nr:MAG: hypothetical protein CO141_00250 [Candidatus Moranbacteria bacterium CG_4_9_14_3_um_filter_42_9]